jgi:ABC-type sugar transport system substrate-binding protein
MSGKKIFASVAAIAVLLFGFAAFVNEAAAAPVKVGISVMTHNNAFFLAEIEGFQAKAAEIWGKDGFEVFTPDPALDVTKQIEQCQDLVNKGVQALLIDAIDVDAIQPAVEAAKAAKIPVIAIDTAIPGLKSDLLTEIYSDNTNAGRIAARELIEAMANAGEIGILNHPEVACVRERTDGLNEVLKDFPNVKIVADVASHGNVIESQQVMETFIQSHPNMKGVFAINDPTAQGAIAAIKASGLDIKVVAVDGSQSAIDMIKAGELICSAAQDPKAIGAKAAECVKAYLDGTKVDDTYVIPTFPIDTKNWKDYDGKQF